MNTILTFHDMNSFQQTRSLKHRASAFCQDFCVLLHRILIANLFWKRILYVYIRVCFTTEVFITLMSNIFSLLFCFLSHKKDGVIHIKILRMERGNICGLRMKVVHIDFRIFFPHPLKCIKVNHKGLFRISRILYIVYLKLTSAVKYSISVSVASKVIVDKEYGNTSLKNT